MGRTLSRLCLALIVLVLAPVLHAAQHADAAPPLRWPFAPGATWRIIQGYNGSTHACTGRICYERYGFDLVREDGKTAGQPVYAMTSGDVAWVDPAHKCLSLDIGGGYFQITCHVDGVERFGHGAAVKQGEQIGVVASPGSDNGGMAHIHVGLYKAASWQAAQAERQPVPFAGLFAIEGVSYPADDSIANQYAGTIVQSQVPVTAAPQAIALSTNLRNGPAAVRAAADIPPGSTSVAISLARGWNLFSVPLVTGDGKPETVLSSIAGAYDVVSAYDTKHGWRSYRPDEPAASDLNRIEPGMGLWIRMVQPATLTVSGLPPASTTITLSKGWNLVGYPSNRTRPVEDVFGPAVPQIERVITYRAVEGNWYSYLPALDAPVNDLEIVTPGRGYWIYAAGEATVRIPW